MLESVTGAQSIIEKSIKIPKVKNHHLINLKKPGREKHVIFQCFFVLSILKEQMREDIFLRSGPGISKNGFYISKWLKEKIKRIMFHDKCK